MSDATRPVVEDDAALAETEAAWLAPGETLTSHDLPRRAEHLSGVGDRAFTTGS